MNKQLPQEQIYRIIINQEKEISLICTKEALKELAIGFLYNEGFISALSDIDKIQVNEDVLLAEITLKEKKMRNLKLVRTTGLGGVGVLKTPLLSKRTVKETYRQVYLNQCKEMMIKQCIQYTKTGGMHCSALFDTKGLLALYEDIGRHNTLDKLAGRCLLEEIDTSDSIVITTGRISTDMIKKMARIGVVIAASYTTPTQQAYELAEKLGITMVGYLGKEKMCIYCGAERLC